MKVISFEEWKDKKKASPDYESEEVEKDFKCSECDGSGELECDLGHWHDCGECGGTGTYSDKVPDAQLTREAYEIEVMSHIVLLAQWVSRWKASFWPELQINYFPACRIKTRELVFSYYGRDIP